MRGRVVRPALEPRGRQVQDGVAAFVDAAGLEFHCAYGNHQVCSVCQQSAGLSESLAVSQYGTTTSAHHFWL